MPLVCVDVVRCVSSWLGIKNQVFYDSLHAPRVRVHHVQQSSRGAPYKSAVQCTHAASFCMLRCHRKNCRPKILSRRQ